MKSLPNFVFYAFGGFDSYLTQFTMAKYKQEYIKLINETQNLPSKPMVFLIAPNFACNSPVFSKGDEGYLVEAGNCSQEAKANKYQTLLEIGKETGIPQEHIIDIYSMLHAPDRKEPGISGDGVHPNRKGMGEIAQEVFMRMSLSPQYLARQQLILQGKD